MNAVLLCYAVQVVRLTIAGYCQLNNNNNNNNLQVTIN